MPYGIDEQDEQTFAEPILAQKGVKLKVNFIESKTWTNKLDGKPYDAVKLTLDIDDTTVRTEHADARPKITLEDQFNIQAYPYKDKSGVERMLGKTKLYQLEEVFGFDPVFTVAGKPGEAYVTKTGSKRAPNIPGVKRSLNPDFMAAYFDDAGKPLVENWAQKTIYADIDIETSETYGSKNVVSRYVKAPVV